MNLMKTVKELSFQVALINLIRKIFVTGTIKASVRSGDKAGLIFKTSILNKMEELKELI